MKFYSLLIEGFKRIKSERVIFGDATFLIGENNTGKSTVLKAIEYLLGGDKSIPIGEYYSICDQATGDTLPACDKIIFEAEFRDVPENARKWRGYRGRIFSYDIGEDTEETGLSIHYRNLSLTANPLISTGYVV